MNINGLNKKLKYEIRYFDYFEYLISIENTFASFI